MEKVAVSAEEIRIAVAEAGIRNFKADYNKKSICTFISSSSRKGLYMKNLLKSIYRNKFGENSQEYTELENRTDENVYFEDNLNIFMEYVSISPDYEDMQENVYNSVGQPEDITADNESEDSFSGMLRDADDETFCDDYGSENYKDFDENIYTAHPESVNLCGDTESRDDSVNFNEIPLMLEDAKVYYSKIVSHSSIIDSIDSDDIFFDSSFGNKVSKNMDIQASDGISVTIKHMNDTVNRDFVIIINHNGIVAVLGKLLESSSPDVFSIEAKKENIDFDIICESNISYSIIWTNNEKNRFYSGNIQITGVSVRISDDTLCIDFGTSNTTAGVYVDSGEKGKSYSRIIQFADVTDPSHRTRNLCPTIVCIDEIREIDENGYAADVKYLFGYDAKKKLIDSGYNPKGDIFFEIKRWITTTNQTESISDGNKTAKIRRRDIISAYLHYIVERANQDMRCIFRNLHFSAPVKLKNDFIHFLRQEVFPPYPADGREYGYNVMNPDESIDEGVAIVYNHISENIINNSVNSENNSGEKENIIIIDCGGGTTDLTSCHYSYSKENTGYSLRLETKFENGDSNFGGNNITYRIFQLIKIKLAKYYEGGNSDETIRINISDFISSNQNDVLNEVDSCINAGLPMSIYNKLDEESRKSENILPTDFNGSSPYSKSVRTRNLMRRNFYYLWQLADDIKKKFFTRTDVVSVPIAAESGDCIVNADSENLYLYVRNPESSVPPLISTNRIAGMKKFPDIIMNFKEIEDLIRPDIYYLLSKIFVDDFSGYSRIHLSGQTCKINLFQDLLKEFIPGRKLRLGKITGTGDILSEKLKMDCVNGCIAYVRDRKFHMVDTENIIVGQNVIYNAAISRGAAGIMENSLFNGKDFVSENGKLVSKPLHIELFRYTEGSIKLIIYSATGVLKKEQEINIPLSLECNEDNIISLSETYEDDNVHLKLRNMLDVYSYHNLRNYMVQSDGTETGIVDDLIRRIEAVEVKDGDKNIIVFAVPNNDGYGFVLYEIIKEVDLYGNVTYYNPLTVHGPFESETLSKSFFSGCNCDNE